MATPPSTDLATVAQAQVEEVQVGRRLRSEIIRRVVLDDVALQLRPQADRLEDMFAAVSEAAESGDLEGASKLFRRAMYAKERFHHLASEMADTFIEGASRPLLDSLSSEQIEAAPDASEITA